jgi:hypothetical protein
LFGINDAVLADSMLTITFRQIVTAGKNRWKAFFYTSRTSPSLRCVLRIRNVKSFSVQNAVNDTLDINELTYDESKGRLRIITGIPSDITIEVTAFHVSVEVLDQVVGTVSA